MQGSANDHAIDQAVNSQPKAGELNAGYLQTLLGCENDRPKDLAHIIQQGEQSPERGNAGWLAIPPSPGR